MTLLEQHAPEANSIVNELSDVVRPLVAAIETSVPTTQNHYGEYMGAISHILGKLPDDQRTDAAHLACGLAMVRAGANRQGVVMALHAMGYL